MTTYVSRTNLAFLGTTSLLMGGLGLALYFLQPFGILFGAAGTITGLAGIAVHFSRGGKPLRLAVGGLLLSGAALATGLVLPYILTGRIDQDYFRGQGRESAPYTAPQEAPPPYPND